jgi:hypothetical protein
MQPQPDQQFYGQPILSSFEPLFRHLPQAIAQKPETAANSLHISG